MSKLGKGGSWHIYSKTSNKWTPFGPEKMFTFERCSLFVIYHKLVYLVK